MIFIYKGQLCTDKEICTEHNCAANEKAIMRAIKADYNDEENGFGQALGWIGTVGVVVRNEQGKVCDGEIEMNIFSGRVNTKITYYKLPNPL